MASNTPNLGLRKPAATDTVNVVTDLGENFDKLDLLATAAGIDFAPTGTVAATNVQAAIAEVAADSATNMAIFASTYGAVGDGVTDDTAAIQAAITAAAGRLVFCAAGTYKITSTLTYTTTGNVAGLRLVGAGVEKTIFDNRVANGPMLSLNGASAPLNSTFARGAELRDFKITTTTSPVVSRGIDFRSQWYVTLENIRITGLTSDGIKVTNNGTVAGGDPDASNLWQLTNVQIDNNGGIGLNIPDPTFFTATGIWTLENCTFNFNLGGGAYLQGLQFIFLNTNVAWNNNFGVKFPLSTAATRQAIFILGEFDGNQNYHLDALNVTQLEMRGTKFITRSDVLPGVQPLIGVRCGGGVSGVVTNPLFDGCVVRNDTATMMTLFYLSSTCSAPTVRRTRLESSSTYITVANDLTTGGQLRIEQDGIEVVRSATFSDRVLAALIRNVANNGPFFSMGANNIQAIGVTPGQVVLQVFGAASQTNDLQQWKNDAGTVLANVSNTGLLTVFFAGPGVSKTLELGANDSAGAGFRTVRVPN